MKKYISIFLFSTLLICGCTAPQYIWPQKDIFSHEINQPTLEKKILVASRKSEFKSAIVKRIENTFRTLDIYIKVIGIDDLEFEDAYKYSAVVLINTAMAWELDRKVEAFLARHKDLNSIIVLVTSGSGDFLPATNERQIDAVSTASINAETEHVADKIISKINKLIKE